MNNKKLLYIVFIMSLTRQSFTWKMDDFGKDFVDLMTSLHNTCINKTGTQNAAIESIKHGNFIENKEIKEYITCLWQESTVLETNGIINMDIVMKLCPPALKDKVPKMISDCWKEVEGVTPLVEKIYEMEKCMYRISSEDFVMF